MHVHTHFKYTYTLFPHTNILHTLTFYPQSFFTHIDHAHTHTFTYKRDILSTLCSKEYKGLANINRNHINIFLVASFYTIRHNFLPIACSFFHTLGRPFILEFFIG